MPTALAIHIDPPAHLGAERAQLQERIVQLEHQLALKYVRDRGLTGEAKRTDRLTQAKPVVDAFFAWAEERVQRAALKRQALPPDAPNGTDRPDWSVALFRYTAKVSRQVLRFFKHCFLKRASPGRYHRELPPMLLAYL